MVPLWFTLSALCFVGAAVLLYVDIDQRRGRSRRRRSWARSHGFDFEAESTEILRRWKRGVMSTVGDAPVRNVVLGQIRGVLGKNLVSGLTQYIGNQYLLGQTENEPPDTTDKQMCFMQTGFNLPLDIRVTNDGTRDHLRK